MRKARADGRSPGEGRHVRMHHWLMSTPAWRSLGPAARAVYLDLAARYNGSNNGRIPYSVRDAARELHIGKTTAAAALADLQDRGFVVPARRGHFDRKLKHSTEWRLTEFACNLTGTLASKDFARRTAEDFVGT